MNSNIGIIFDMDGVIIDSNPFHKIAWTNFFLRRNVYVDDIAFRELIFGTTGDEAIVKLLKQDFSKTELDMLNAEIDAEYREIINGSQNLEPVNGFIQFIESVSEKKYKIALATSAPPENVELILDKFGITGFFDLIMDNTQITLGKPHPEIYLNTVSRLGLPKSRCIVFEDSISGIISAKNAGLIVIGITTSHSDAELINAGASSCISDFTGISADDIKFFLLVHRNL